MSINNSESKIVARLVMTTIGDKEFNTIGLTEEGLSVIYSALWSYIGLPDLPDDGRRARRRAVANTIAYSLDQIAAEEIGRGNHFTVTE